MPLAERWSHPPGGRQLPPSSTGVTFNAHIIETGTDSAARPRERQPVAV